MAMFPRSKKGEFGKLALANQIESESCVVAVLIVEVY
jgi:hypothetical protein